MTTRITKLTKGIVCLVLGLAGASFLRAQEMIPPAHSVILLIPDGCGVAHMTVARWCKEEPLAQDSMAVSLVRTFSANSLITGSAAAATAFATGYKTWEAPEKARCLSLLPDSLLIPVPRVIPEDRQWRPVATVLEGARLAGKATGLVATCRASHATPAAFASHWFSRYDDNIIMEQIVYQGLDVLLAGGFRYCIDHNRTIPGSAAKGVREDGEDLTRVLTARGYALITTRNELHDLPSSVGKVWGSFAHSHMSHDIDRGAFAPDEPSLAEMTQKAIDILNRDPDGFFLMVEGSQVDWSSHDNEPIGTITDYLAFDRAVQVAVDYARSHPEQRTIILVVPDHDNGGMSLGRNGVDSYTFNGDRIKTIINHADLTADGVARVIDRNIDPEKPDRDALRRILGEHLGITDLTSEEVNAIVTELADTPYVYLPPVLGSMISARIGVGWTTFDHTGHDVPLFSYGLEEPPRTIDNTEIARICARAMGFTLDDISDRLFADAQVLFENAAITIDTTGTGVSNGQLVVEKDGETAVFPFFKNIMVMDEDTVLLEGLTVYSRPIHKVFLPRQAKDVFDAR